MNKEMNILFLDFDGVLNNKSSMFLNMFANNDRLFMSKAAPNVISVRLVEWLLTRCDTHVVVSSSWRQGLTVEGLQDVLEYEFLSPLIASRVIDKTKNTDLREVRGHQIKYWLDYTAPQMNIVVKKYLILDDDSDMLKSQKSHFVQTTSDSGFAAEYMRQAVSILGYDYDQLLKEPHPV